MPIYFYKRPAWRIAAGVLYFSALACKLVIPSTPTPQPTQTPLPTLTETLPPTATIRPTEAPATSTTTATNAPTDTPTPSVTIPKAGFVIAEIDPSEGTLAELLQKHAAEAKAMGLTAYVEFTATWCPACQAIEEALGDQNELMLDAFQGTYLIPVDIDIWPENEQEEAGFSIEFIPIYFEIDENGQPTGEAIGGDAWEENIPENMAPALREFFQAHAAPK